MVRGINISSPIPKSEWQWNTRQKGKEESNEWAGETLTDLAPDRRKARRIHHHLVSMQSVFL